MLLENYISNLVLSVTEARAKADMQTAKLAQLYLKDDLLRHFPVPHMRIGEVIMDVPVAVNAAGSFDINYYVSVDETTIEVGRAVGIGYNAKNDDGEYVVLDIDLIHEHINTLKYKVEQSHSLDALPECARRIAYESRSVLMSEGYIGDDNDISPESVSIDVEKVLRKRFILNYDELNSVDVIVESAKLKELPPQSIVNFKLKIIEEGTIWAISKNADGEIETKLIPE